MHIHCVHALAQCWLRSFCIITERHLSVSIMKSIVVALALQYVVAEDLAETICLLQGGNPRVGRTALLDTQVESDCEIQNSNLENLGNVQCFTTVKSKCRGDRTECRERTNQRFLDNLLQTHTSVDLLETDIAETSNRRAVYFACTSRDVGGDREAAACSQYEVTREEDCQTSAVQCPLMIAGRSIPAEVSCFRRCGNHHARPNVLLHTQVKDGNSAEATGIPGQDGR